MSITLAELKTRTPDILSELLGMEVFEELDRLIDSLYESQMQDKDICLEELRAASHSFQELWKECRRFEGRYRGQEIFVANEEVILLAMTILVGANLTIVGFSLKESVT